jgi:hypothetical protein
VKIQNGNGDDGFYIYQEHDDVTFIDFIFCPSLTNPLTDDMVKIDENDPVVGVTTPSIPNTITFDGCIFSDIDSSGDPFVTSKADVIDLDLPADINAMVSGSGRALDDDLLKIWGDDGEFINYVLKDCVFFDPAARNIELYLDGTGGETGLIQDCLFANKPANGQYGITARARESGSSVSIIGTQSPRLGDLTKCTATLESGGHLIYSSGTTGSYTTIKNFLGVNDGATVVRVLSAGSDTVLCEDSIFCAKTGANNIVTYPVNQEDYNRCTFYMPGSTGFIYSGSADPGQMTFTDCVIAGAGLGPYTGTNGTGDKLVNCAIATAGPDAITTLGITLIEINSVYGDPGIISKDVKNANFMDTSAGNLFMAASDAASIGGGANYTIPDASDNLQNALWSFGDCEADFIFDSSERAGVPLDAALLDDQNQVAGVIGNATKFSQEITGSRFEGLSNIIPVAFDGNDQTFTMYFKIPTGATPSYPRFSIKRNQTVTPPQELAGHDQAVLLDNAAFAAVGIDSMWHQITPDVSTMTWDGDDTVSVFVHSYFPYGPEINLDEMVYDDPTVDTRVEEWGLF